MFVIINRGPRQSRHRFTLRAADEDADFFRREILHLARMNQQSFGNLDVAQVFSDLRRAGHGTANECDLATMLPGQLYGQLDAMD